jgi:hypothetical protein
VKTEINPLNDIGDAKFMLMGESNSLVWRKCTISILHFWRVLTAEKDCKNIGDDI